jgi:L-asparaginase II
VPSASEPLPVIAEVVRSGFVEGHHRGSVMALAADGSVAWAVGDVRRPVLPRSCLKPLQALGMLRAGLDLPSELLALACASHAGEPFHLDGVRDILAAAGLDESVLRTPPDLPLEQATREAYLRSGGERSPLVMNCSGKHAAMLATCVLRGWPLDDYRSPDHPLQLALADTVAELTGETPTVAVDGCGAPALSASLLGLARAFRLLARGEGTSGQADPGAARVADAIRAHPAYVSGTGRDEVRLLRAVPGMISKLGAEACYAAALPDGRTWAVKVDDGGDRARPVVMAAALLRDGVGAEPGVDRAALERLARTALLGGNQVVGEVRPVLPAS